MSRTAAILGLVTVLSLGGCASSSGTSYSVTPRTQVVVRDATKRPAQANFRVTPEAAMRAGAGGGGSEE